MTSLSTSGRISKRTSATEHSILPGFKSSEASTGSDDLASSKVSKSKRQSWGKKPTMAGHARVQLQRQAFMYDRSSDRERGSDRRSESNLKK